MRRKPASSVERSASSGQRPLLRRPGPRRGFAALGLLAAAAWLAPAVQGEPLTSPPVLPNRSSAPNTVEVNLTAEPTRLSLVPGTQTNVWAYNGRVPGPTLEVREGDRVIVHFQNNLPEATTIHWHGIHLPVEADGNPMDPVPPGGSYDYVFTVHPGTAGTYWYHPHPHRRALRHMVNGLFGALIVRAPTDPLPSSIPEKLLILWDNKLKADGSIDLSSPLPILDDVSGREGNVLFVNGQIQPTVTIRSGEVQRWRIINAAAGRYYRLSLSDHQLLHVGSDGGLFERPVEVQNLLVPASDRVELLVRGTGAPGSQSRLQSLPHHRYWDTYTPRDWNKTLDLLTLQYSPEEPIAPPAIPPILRPITALDPARAAATRTVTFSVGTINGQYFSMSRVDIRAKLNTTEVWRLVNSDGMEHPFHLHGFPFQVLDATGVPIPVWEDTINLPKYRTVRIIVEFRDYPGRRMFHCHQLTHEDTGMMGIVEVQ